MIEDPAQLNALTERIIAAAVEVHRHLGPGLLESSYQRCLRRELELSGLRATNELELPLRYKGETIECGYRIDLLVEESVVVEVKSVKALEPIHIARALTYLKLGGWKVSLLVNFNVPMLIKGVKRVVHNLAE